MQPCLLGRIGILHHFLIIGRAERQLNVSWDEAPRLI